MRIGLRETLRVDALRTDAYVESLIAGASMPSPPISGPVARDPGAPVPPAAAPVDPGAPDPDIAAVARLLHASAVRPHPSFRFEERLAARISAVARGASTAATAARPAPAAIVAFPGAVPVASRPDDIPSHPVRAVAPIAGLASAAVASAALSIGAAAVVAWRRNRPRRGIA